MGTTQPKNNAPEPVLGLNKTIINVPIARVKPIYIAPQNCPKISRWEFCPEKAVLQQYHTGGSIAFQH